MLRAQRSGAVAAKRNKGPRKTKRRLGAFEQLESRALLSASTLASLVASPSLAVYRQSPTRSPTAIRRRKSATPTASTR